MDEKRRHSIEALLNDEKAPGHSARDITERANRQAEEILRSLKDDHVKKESNDAEFDAFLASLIARADKRKSTVESEPLPAKVEPSQSKPKLVKVEVKQPDAEITVAPGFSNVPQIKKKYRSLDEVSEEAMPEEDLQETAQSETTLTQMNREAAFFEAVREEEPAPKPEPLKAAKRERHLSTTGAIRKADKLPAVDFAQSIGAATAAEGAGRLGNPKPVERIVGDKEDIQTKAYHAYIRNREKKKQDTGMIKSIDIKLADKTLADGRTNVVLPKAAARAVLIDEETNLEKTIAAGADKRVITAMHHTGNLEGQTSIEGFFDDEEVEKITEDELEEQLEISRRKKMDSFAFEKEYQDKIGDAQTAAPSGIDETYAPEKETPVIHDVIDYNSKNDRRAIYIELEQLFGRFKLRTILTAAAVAVSMVIGLIASANLLEFGLETAGENVYILINSILLLFMMIVNARVIFKGLKALFLLKPSADSLVAVAAMVTLVHCITAFLLSRDGAGVSHLYTGAMGVVFLMNCFGKRSLVRRVFKNFRFIIKGGEKYSAAGITQPKEIKEFAKGSEQENPDIRYNAKTAFPTRFLAHSFADDPSDTVAKYITYPVIGASVLIGVIAYFIGKDMMGAFSACCAALLAGLPACGIMSFNKALENADNALLKERGTITGFAAVNSAAEASAVVVDGAELFPEGYCSLKGMKLYKKMQMDEAILYAAGVLENTRHPFKPVFMESISEVKEKMPKSFDTVYESGLGLSGWIYDRKVLLGNKEMMGAHGIEIPANARPESYIKENVRVLFLAIDGVVYAMFVVEYFSDARVESELQRLEASGVELLVKTDDANVDEELLSEIFEIDAKSVRILNSLAGKIFEEKSEKPVYNEAQLVNRGDAMTFIRSLIACSVLSGQFRFLKTLHYVSVVIGLAVMLILAIFGNSALIGPVHIGVYAAFWMVLTNVIPRIYKAVPKR